MKALKSCLKPVACAGGVISYALGPVYTKSNDKVRAYFGFAKGLGAKVIAGIPYDAMDEKFAWLKWTDVRRRRI